MELLGSRLADVYLWSIQLWDVRGIVVVTPRCGLAEVKRSPIEDLPLVIGGIALKENKAWLSAGDVS